MAWVWPTCLTWHVSIAAGRASACPLDHDRMKDGLCGGGRRVGRVGRQDQTQYNNHVTPDHESSLTLFRVEREPPWGKVHGRALAGRGP